MTALLTKDLAYLLIVVALTAPLVPLAGLAAGLTVLAVGHHIAVCKMFVQHRWGFVSASLVPHGVIQVVAFAGAATMTYRESPAFAAWPAAAYALSLLFYGWLFDCNRPIRWNFLRLAP